MTPDCGHRFALCALLLLASLATLSAQEMSDDMMNDGGAFYVTAAYSAALPGERDLLDQARTIAVGTEIGFLGGRIGVGYVIAGFRPEISAGYRSAMVDSLKVKKYDQLHDAALKALNKAIAGAAISGTIISIDLAANVYYDVDTGSAIIPYVGVGGGLSHVAVKPEHFAGQGDKAYDDTAWPLSFQAAAGIGYAVTEDLTLTLGYRLIGTMEANFSKYDTSEVKVKTGLTLSHTVELGLRLSF